MPPTKRDVEVLERPPCGCYVKARVGKDVVWLTPAEAAKKKKKSEGDPPTPPRPEPPDPDDSGDDQGDEDSLFDLK